MPGRASGIKIFGTAEVGHQLGQMGWQSIQIVGCVGLCYLHFAPENPEDGKQRYDIWYHPVRSNLLSQYHYINPISTEFQYPLSAVSFAISATSPDKPGALCLFIFLNFINPYAIYLSFNFSIL